MIGLRGFLVWFSLMLADPCGSVYRKRATKPAEDEPETVQTLEAKLNVVNEKLSALEYGLSQERARLAKEAAAASASTAVLEGGDLLDVYMMQNAGNAQRDLETVRCCVLLSVGLSVGLSVCLSVRHPVSHSHRAA